MAVHFIGGSPIALYTLDGSDISDPSQVVSSGAVGTSIVFPRGMANYNGRLYVGDANDRHIRSFLPASPGTVTDEGLLPSGLVNRRQ